MPNSLLDFKERARLLGVSPDTDFRGVVRIESLARLKEILHDDKNGKAIAAHMFDGIAAPEGDLTSELSRKISEYVYGDVTFSKGEMAVLNTAAPLDANVISIPEKTIDSAWNLNDETPTGAVIVSVGKLTIKDGGYVLISNRALDFTVDTLVREGTTRPEGRGEFNIMGVDGGQGAVGDQPPTPGQAKSGAPGNCSSAGIAGKSGGDGTPGTQGPRGGEGERGKDGAPSLQAVIRVTKSVQAPGGILTVTRSGAGGKGGQGGKGATGGKGGNGGNGVTCGCTGNSGGSGATGGKGGTGGTGGPGGNGVNAAGQITVIAPAADLDKFDDTPLGAPPGEGGDPGLRGDGGAGGSGGSGGKHNDGGSGAGAGPDGDPGERGAAGTVTGAPALVAYQPA